MDLSSRKFWLAVGIEIVVTIAFFLGKVPVDAWLLSLGLNGGAYGLLNVWEKISTNPIPAANDGK